MTTSAASLESTSLPPRGWFRSMAYCPAADVILATVGTGTGSEARERIYYRSIHRNEYAEVAYPDDDRFSYRDVVVAVDQPFAFFSQWEPLSDGFDWCAVLRVDLTSGVVDEIVSRTALNRLSETGRSWIASLQCVSLPLGKLFCTVAAEHEKDGGSHVVYHLASLDLTTRIVEMRTVLERHFY